MEDEMFMMAALCGMVLTVQASEPLNKGSDRQVEAAVDEGALDIERVNRLWNHVALGYQHGLLGSGFVQSLIVDVPFSDYFGVRLRGQGVLDALPIIAGGGAEFFGRGPVLYGVIRAYGGGGLVVFPNADAQLEVGGRGHFGFEVLVSPRTTFMFEIGGQGGGTDRVSGGSAMGGVTVYLGR